MSKCYFLEALDDAIRGDPSRIAVASSSIRTSQFAELTYSALNKGAAEIEAYLRDLGVRTDEPVLVFTSNLPSDLQSFLGVWRAGAVAVPVHRDTVGEAVRAIQSRVRARFLVTGPVMPSAQLPPGESRGSGASTIYILPADAPIHRDILQDGALVMFTSGSTGEPKGVVLSRTSFITKLRAIDQILNFPKRLRSLLVLQLNFAFGQWVSVLTLLRCGTLLVSPKFVALDCLRDMMERHVDQIAVVPTMLRAMLSEFRSEEGKLYLASLQQAERPSLLCTGGEHLAAALGQRIRSFLPQTGIADVFGLTETCTSDFILPPALFDRYLGSIGFPTPGVEFRIVDPSTGRAVDAGETGELEIKTKYVMTGYLEAPALTAAQFHDGYFKTGDLARLGRDQEVYLAGRIKDVIIRGGNKISPIEVDSTLIRHPDVDASMTVGVADALMGERICTVILVRNGSHLRPEVLRNWAGQYLDKFKVPDQIHIAERLPQGRTGKDDRRALLLWLRERERLN